MPYTFKLVHERTGKAYYYGSEQRGAYVLNNGRRFRDVYALLRFATANNLVYEWF